MSGLVVLLTFKTAEAESRFKKWVLKGNEKALMQGVANLGLKARILKVEDKKYLFSWEHFFILNLSWFLRLMLWVQTKRIRKDVRIESVKKLFLVDVMMKRGLGDAV